MPSPRKRIFYGWWVATAAAIGLGLGGPPILVFSFPVFLKALTKDFHASRAAISLAFSLHNLVAAFAAPFAGRLIDQVGIRKIVLPGTVLFAAWMLGNRFITVSILGIYIFNMVGALLGNSCGPIPYAAAVSNWFDRRRGTALAVMMLGLGVSTVVMPSIVQRIITLSGWRPAYALYGATMLLVSVPVIATLLKDKPAQMGLYPDGASPSLLRASEERQGLTSLQALRTSTFWIMVSAVVLLGASVHGCVLHLVAMLTDRGMTAQTAALASSLAGAGLLTGRVGTGFLLDRYFGPRVAMGFSGGAALGILLLLIMRGGAMPFLAAFLVGFGMGAEGDLITYLTSRYFGLKSFAEIYGLAFGSFVIAGAAGTWLMGFGFDRSGSYTVTLLGFLAAVFVAIVLFSLLGAYRYVAFKPEEATSELQVSAAVP